MVACHPVRAASRLPLACALVAAGATALSGIGPHRPEHLVDGGGPDADRAAAGGRGWRRFPLTPLLCVALAVHACVLALGGHYTYAEVPLGFWVRDALGLARNHYDRLGHLAQGFVPALLARELLLRTSPLRPGRWLFALVSLSILGVSACYELIEWWTALALGQGADAFLGTQGDPWDTQWDMFLALCGAVLAQLTLSGLHDRQLAALRPP